VLRQVFPRNNRSTTRFVAVQRAGNSEVIPLAR